MDFTNLSEKFSSLMASLCEYIGHFGESLTSSARLAIAEEKSAIWATLITDIITIAAALGALALPISLNVIETTRSRYKSPSLLKIIPSISRVNAKNLNRQLFLILASALAAKLMLSTRAIETLSLAPYLCGLSIWFSYISWKVYQHLRFTYTFMSNIEAVHELVLCDIENHASANFFPANGWTGKFARLIAKLKSISISNHELQHSIVAIIELEGHLITSDPRKTDLNSRIVKISNHAINNLDNKSANFFTQQLLAALPQILADVEQSREVDIYQKVSSFYLYLTMKALLSKEEYKNNIKVIERIARFREDKLPPHGRFCRNGRIFLHFANGSTLETKTYEHLRSHFNLLIDTSAHEQPENIPELLSNVRQVVQFKSIHHKGAWDIADKIEELWRYSGLPQLDDAISETFAGRMTWEELEKALNERYRPEMINWIKANTQEKNNIKDKLETLESAIDECRRGISINKFSKDIEIKTLRTLAVLANTHPEIFIACRELRNPAGSKSFNIGHSPVPTSIMNASHPLLI